MNHELFKEWVQLYYLDELTENEKKMLNAHLKECDECSRDLLAMEKLNNIIKNKRKVNVSNELLADARTELRAAIRLERKRIPLTTKMFSSIKEFFVEKRSLVYGSTASLAIGLLLGYFFFKTPVPDIQNIKGGTELTSNVQIDNVKFIDSDASDGTVEFSFNAIKPVTVRGNINDEKIRNVLMYSLLNEQNPGVRLSSLNAINSKQKLQNNDLKEALINVIKFDNNPGVRREAITTLSKFSYDEDIKKAFIYVLLNDTISGMRIEAINKLVEATEKGFAFSPDELNMLKSKAVRDDNNYVRYKAETVIKEFN